MMIYRNPYDCPRCHRIWIYLEPRPNTIPFVNMVLIEKKLCVPCEEKPERKPKKKKSRSGTVHI